MQIARFECESANRPDKQQQKQQQASNSETAKTNQSVQFGGCKFYAEDFELLVELELKLVCK